MLELVCDTSPLQYLHQLGLLDILRDLADRVIVPPSVVDELAAGRTGGFDVPLIDDCPWITIHRPRTSAVERAIADLGAGESQVLMLALESPGRIAVLDDRAAHRAALAVNVELTGTLGPLLDAKRAGRIPALYPLLVRLRQLGFRVSTRAQKLLLEKAGETA